MKKEGIPGALAHAYDVLDPSEEVRGAETGLQTAEASLFSRSANAGIIVAASGGS